MSSDNRPNKVEMGNAEDFFVDFDNHHFENSSNHLIDGNVEILSENIIIDTTNDYADIFDDLSSDYADIFDDLPNDLPNKEYSCKMCYTTMSIPYLFYEGNIFCKECIEYWLRLGTRYPIYGHV